MSHYGWSNLKELLPVEWEHPGDSAWWFAGSPNGSFHVGVKQRSANAFAVYSRIGKGLAHDASLFRFHRAVGGQFASLPEAQRQGAILITQWERT